MKDIRKKKKVCRGILPSITAVLLLILLSGCGARIGDFTASSTKNFNVPLSVKETGPRVSGQDCAYRILGLIPVGHVVPDAKEATDQALEKANANFLLDTVWDVESVWYILASQVCLTVEGTPVTLQ